MSKTIDGIPDFLTREQYLALFEAVGVTPEVVSELRMAHDGVHMLVIATREDGGRIPQQPLAEGYEKHRVFIPVRDSDKDRRTTRVRPVHD